MRYYLIRGDTIVSMIDTSAGDVVALPLVRVGIAMSLLSEQHALNLMANLSLTREQALAALGLMDVTASALSTVFVAPNPVSLHIPLEAAVYHLLDVGDYALWQVVGQLDHLIALHKELYAMAPAGTLGALAVVQKDGVAFSADAVATVTGQTAQERIERRDRVADYLDSLGGDTTVLRAATDEHAQMEGIMTALGYTMQQLWDAMVSQEG